MPRIHRGVRTAVVGALVAALLPTALAGSASAEEVDRATARDALNAACAASQQAASSGVTMADALSTGRVGGYDAVAGTIERSDRAIGGRHVYTTVPPVRYEWLNGSDSFVARALKSLGSTATWAEYASSAADVADAIPSPGVLLRGLLLSPGSTPSPPSTCADALTQDPRAGLVAVDRTVQGDLTEWRILLPPRYFRLPSDDAARILYVDVSTSGVISRLREDAYFEDGVGGPLQDLSWQYGTWPDITVPGPSEVVDGTRYLQARAAYVPTDMRALARRVADKRLRKPTVRAVRSRVLTVWLKARLDPLFKSFVDEVRGGSVAWQQDPNTSGYVAYRFTPRPSGRIAFRRVPGFTP